MQAESSLWGRKRVVGSKLKHDGTLGYISRGAARRSGLNPAGWHRYVPILVEFMSCKMPIFKMVVLCMAFPTV